MPMEQFFLFCAIFGGAFVVVQTVMTLLGVGGHDMDGAGSTDVDLDGVADDGSAEDASSDHSGSAFLHAFSVRSLSAGIAFFGLGGMIALSLDQSPAVAVVVGFVCGLIATYAVFHLMRMLSKFNQDGSVRTALAVGSTGTVYLRIPAKRAGVGKVSIVQQERILEYDAVTDADEELKSGTPIVVVEVLAPSQLLVAKQNGDNAPQA